MQSAKLFQNGGSQAIRLPKEFQFSGTDVYIQKVGDTVMVFPKEKVWETFLHGLSNFTDDYLQDREQPSLQDREGL